MVGSGLNLSIDEVDGVSIFRMDGRLDTVASSTLDTHLKKCIDGGCNTIILDFTDVEYISSAGIRVVLSYTKRLQLMHGWLRCCSMGESVLQVIGMAGFAKILSIFRTEQEAIDGKNP